MSKRLRVLVLEDVVTDAELSLRYLRQAGMQCSAQLVANETDFRRGLQEFSPDVILSDFSLPGFDGLAALQIAKQLCPEVPYLFVSGTIGEERAIESIKLGATDYVLKSSLSRLATAVGRALQEANDRAEHRRIQRDLQQSEERFRLLVNGVTDYAIFMLDTAGRLISWNTGAERIFGYSEDEILGRPCCRFYPLSEDAESVVAAELERVRQSAHVEHEALQMRKDGSLFWADITITALHDGTDTVNGFAVVTHDVTERKSQQEKIARLSRIHAVLSGINAAIVRIRERAELFAEACRIAVEDGGFGVAWIGNADPETHAVVPVAAAGDSQWLIESPHAAGSNAGTARGLIARAIAEQRPAISNDLTAEPGAGSERRMQAIDRGYRSAIALPLFVGDAVVGTLGLIARETGMFTGDEVKLLSQLAADISFALDHMEKEERLNYLAYYDALTGLPNRTLFHDRLTRLLQSTRSNGGRLALLLIDISRFRLVNESLGRNAGDMLLQGVARRLSEVLPDKGGLARVGPNLFATVVSNAKDAAQVAHLVQTSLLEVESTPLKIGDQDLQVSLTAGIALHPEDAADADVLYRNAEAALLKAKRSGDRYLFYEPAMNARVAKTLTLENKLRRAIEREQFLLHYQPKVDLHSGVIVGLEALIRWNDPDAGLVAPMEFIPILEETGMILEVGRWALEQAVAEYARLHASGLQCPRIAVNVSAVQLRRREFVSILETAIRKSPGAAHGLDLEITESVAMENVAENIPKLKAVREMGIAISIDDFGTGYSSLGYIAKLPVDALKIDRAFIVNLTTSVESKSIVSSVISLAHDLKIKVIAEGVETEEQARLLRMVKCDQMQGYLISRPVPAQDIAAMIYRAGAADRPPD